MADTFYRTVFTVTVLSKQPVAHMDMSRIARRIYSGDLGGSVELTASRELTKREVAVELQDHGDDPELLLGEDGWKYALGEGDEVTWDNPGDGGGSRTVTIQQIDYAGDDVVRITDKDGNYLEAPVGELS